MTNFRRQKRSFVGIGIYALALAALVQFSAPPSALAGGDAFAACALKAADKDLEAKVQFQNKLHDMIVTSKPEFKALAAINRDLQISMAEERRDKVDYLLKKHPERVVTDQGLSKFSNFDWSDADEGRFLATSEAYQKRHAAMSDLTKQNNFHPDWPRLRGFFRGELTKKPAYKTLMTEFTSGQIEVKKQLASCTRGK